MARATRQSIYGLDHRSRWTCRHRLWRVRRARDIPDRQGRHRPLQADRTAHARGTEAKDSALGAGAAAVTARAAIAALLLACAAAATAADAVPPSGESAAGMSALDMRL